MLPCISSSISSASALDELHELAKVELPVAVVNRGYHLMETSQIKLLNGIKSMSIYFPNHLLHFFVGDDPPPAYVQVAHHVSANTK